MKLRFLGDKSDTWRFLRIKCIITLKKLDNFKNKNFIYQNKTIGWKGDIPKYSYDISKLKKDFGVKIISSKKAIDKTISEIIKWWLQGAL